MDETTLRESVAYARSIIVEDDGYPQMLSAGDLWTLLANAFAQGSARGQRVTREQDVQIVEASIAGEKRSAFAEYVWFVEQIAAAIRAAATPQE